MESKTKKYRVVTSPRSVSLTKEEFKKLRAHSRQKKPKIELAYEIGIDRTVYNKIIFSGTGAEKTVNKIREYFKNN